MISADRADVCTVISILPMILQESKPGLVPGQYTIPACFDPQGCETLMVGRAKFHVYIDESRPALSVPEPSDMIAQAICRDFKVSSARFAPGEAEPGLFWTRGGYTNEEVLVAKELREELESTRRKQTGWFKALVSEADDDWNRYHMRRMISDLQRIAAKQLGVEREWDIDQEVTPSINVVKCKFCRADVHAEAIICMHCHGVLHMDRFKKEFISAETVKQQMSTAVNKA